MTTVALTIQVDADAAQAFVAAPSEDKRKMQLLLSLRLRDMTTAPARSLQSVMDEIGRNAEARGMTEAVLDSLLHGS
jgi:hypothetical protein